MMTIREYFETIEDLETRWEEEGTLFEAIETDEDFDLEAWAQAHNVDLDARSDRLNETILTLWMWDMCGE
jgi:hypothetical protein